VTLYASAGPAFCPIELLHPDGPGLPGAVIGRASERFFAPVRPAAGSQSLDFVLVAPDANERADPGFLQQAAALISGSLSTDGLAYVVAPVHWQRRLRRRLPEADFAFGPTIVHLPPGVSDQILVPADTHLLRYAASALTNMSWVSRRLLAAALRLPGIQGAIRRTSEVGVVVRRTGARLLLEWLASDGHDVASAVIRTKWRAYGGTAILHCFPADGATPVAVAKVVLDDRLAGRVESEAKVLELLGSAAARAGVRVPTANVLRSRGGHAILVEPYLCGQRAHPLLRSRAVDAVSLLSDLTRWLEAWNGATTTPGVLDERRLETHLLGPARRLAPHLKRGTTYVDWLQQLGSTVVGRPMPSVATHNDLTMQNVLLLPGSPPAVVDWEAASDHGFPLTDFFYMAVDLFAAARAAENRTDVLLDCFAADTPRAESVARLGERLAQTSGLSNELMKVAFHACWIQHASNELEKKHEADRRPFLSILHWLADHPGNIRLPGMR